jgi:hypothetical protein
MLKLTTLTFTLIAALSFGATTANAGMFSGNRAPQPTSVSAPTCQYGYENGHCVYGPKPGFGNPGAPGCNPRHHDCSGPTVPDCKGGSQTIYGTTHECL